MKSYTVKEDHIGSVVTKKLKYRQTDKHINRQTFPRSMRSYTVKEDHIGSVVTEKN